MIRFFRRRKSGHPHARELRGLMSCIIAWRRAVIEHRFEDQVADVETLGEDLSALRWYATGAGGADPFTEHVLAIPVGGLDESLRLIALWRIEAAASISWALQLQVDIPSIETPADWEALSALYPLADEPSWSNDEARLRGRAELVRARDHWLSATKAARRARGNSEASELQFSRALERAQGLVWVTSDALWIEDVSVDV